MSNGIAEPLITILEFETFSDDADKLLSAEERVDLLTLLAATPEAGDLIRGTGGFRKLRIGLEGKKKGKRGGGRVIYYFYNEKVPLALVSLYAKGEKIDLTAEEKKELRQIASIYTKSFSI